jgi:ribosome-associated heat shock protein Hsp15
MIETEINKVRIDKYLWAIRIYKTRSLATKACDDGKIKCNGNAVKASKNIAIGDEYEIKTEAKKWIIEVANIVEQRVQYIEAIKNYIDKTPVEEKQINKPPESAFTFNTGKRQSKQARPTKKQRRNLDGFMDS